MALLRLTALLLLSSQVSAGDLLPRAGHDGRAPVRVNPLRAAPQLPKVHYSWSLPPPLQAPFYWDNLSVADGLLVDYARVTGSLSIQIHCTPTLPNTTHPTPQPCS